MTYHELVTKLQKAQSTIQLLRHHKALKGYDLWADEDLEEALDGIEVAITEAKFHEERRTA